MVARLSAPSVAFVLPRAPRGAWWDARAVDPLTPVARAQLSDALDHTHSRSSGGPGRGAPTANASGRLLAGRLPRHRVSLRRFAPAGRCGGADRLPGRRSCGWTIRLRAGRDAGLPLRRRRRSVDSAVGLRGRGAIAGRARREAAGRSVAAFKLWPRPRECVRFGNLLRAGAR